MCQAAGTENLNIFKKVTQKPDQTWRSQENPGDLYNHKEI